MKRTIIHTSAAIALLLGIAACTQDERLPAGRGGRHTHRLYRHGAEPRCDSHRQYPFHRGRRLGGCAERGSPDGRHGEGIRRDAHHRDPASATLTSTDPHYWTDRKDITVTAWCSPPLARQPLLL